MASLEGEARRMVILLLIEVLKEVTSEIKRNGNKILLVGSYKGNLHFRDML